MADPKQIASGVQDLIHRIRDDGVKAAQLQGDSVLREARTSAAQIVADAKAEAEEILRQARSRISAEKDASEAALKLAARDAVKELSSGIFHAFERHVRRLISAQLKDSEFLRHLIVAIATRSVPEGYDDRAVDILLSEEVFRPEAKSTPESAESDRRIRDFILGISGEMIREGVQIKAGGSSGGVSVQVKGEDIKIDLNEKTISEFVLRHLLPRYRRILQGVD